jgi:hypothetical protein
LFVQRADVAEDDVPFAIQPRDMNLVAAGKLGEADCPVLLENAGKQTKVQD